MNPRATVRARAPAKINLWLEVLGRRGDGFHEIRTWMLALDLADRLEARANDRGIVTLVLRGEAAGPDLPRGRENLACRAAHAALDEGRRLGRLDARAGVDLVLEKHIPSRAGLGGGSSDAAAAWIATCAALDLDAAPESAVRTLSRDEILGAIGSDCVFFARVGATGAALCEGRGERVMPTPAPRGDWIVALLTPDLACPTAEVYAACDAHSEASSPAAEPPVDWLASRASAARPFLFNRLERAALEAFPGLRAWRHLLDGSGAEHWRLSGSGSSFFGLYDRVEEAELALERIRGAARSKGLLPRGLWTALPAGTGAGIVEVI